MSASSESEKFETGDFEVQDLTAIKKILSSPESLTDKIDAIVGRGFRVCRWGSCQYGSAQDMYDLLEHLREGGMSIPEICATFGMPSESGPQASLEESKRKLANHLIRDDLDEENEEESVWMQERCDALENASNVADLFRLCNNNAWDLWTATPKIFEAVWPEHPRLDTPTAPGHGPKLNQLVQSDNYLIGTMCWLLRARAVVSDDECFEGFDT
jgi:hypothetical protein